jgi:hypothetical protein
VGGSRLRFFGLIHAQAHLEYDYLLALHETGLGVRVLPVGAGHFQMPNTAGWRRWRDLQEVFSGPLSVHYINVVCARPGVDLGRPLTRRDVAPPTADVKDNNLVYAPKTCLTGLLTVGVPNVAITVAAPLPTADEARALHRYDAVIAPTGEHTDALLPLVDKCACIPPEPEQLHDLFTGIGKARYGDAWD